MLVHSGTSEDAGAQWDVRRCWCTVGRPKMLVHSGTSEKLGTHKKIASLNGEQCFNADKETIENP
eukprot:gene5029-4842_t